MYGSWILDVVGDLFKELEVIIIYQCCEEQSERGEWLWLKRQK